MANNIVDISILSPIKFREQGYTNPLPYNWRYHDDWNYPETVLPFYELPNYLHPWQNNDIIYLPILSNYAPHNITMYNCNGLQVDAFVATYIVSSIEVTGQKFYLASIALTSYPEGGYYFVIKSGSPVIKTLESEAIYIKALHDGSVLLKYKHNENDFDTVFETGLELMFRTYGGFKEFTPKSDRVVFVDQTRNAQQLSGRSYYTEKFIIGNAMGVPDWVAERVNQIFQCSNVTIDGKQFVAIDGATFDPTREENYPMAGWSIEVRPAIQSTKKRFEVDGNSNSPTTVVYNLENDAFGSITGPGSSNIIQIESLD